jgi:hypothetical protein
MDGTTNTMFSSTICLTCNFTLHYQIKTSISPFQSDPNIKIFYLNIFEWLRLPAPVKTDEITKMYSLTPMETTYNNGIFYKLNFLGIFFLLLRILYYCKYCYTSKCNENHLT